MSHLISPEERAALPVARAAMESRQSSQGIADAIVGALYDRGLLQSPETAAELARLRLIVAAAPRIWHVFEEDTLRPVVPSLYATQAAAENEVIARYEESEGSCPDYSWRPGEDSSLELLAGGEPVGIYLAPATVHGHPDPADEPSPYELADDAPLEDESPAARAAREIQALHDSAVRGYVIGLGSLRLILHPRTWEEWASWQRRLAVEVGQTTYRGSVATAHGYWGSAPVTVTCHLDRLPKLTTLAGDRP